MIRTRVLLIEIPRGQTQEEGQNDCGDPYCHS
jgi:hypothetical protein